MKFAKTLLLGIFTLSFVTIQTLAVSPKDTAFVADLDSVLIKRGPNLILSVFLSALPKNPLLWPAYVKAMLGVMKRYKKINGNRIMKDDNGNIINGLTFQWLYCGMKDPILRLYVVTLATFSNKYRRFKPGTKKILEYLKNKGHEINFGTNRDRGSYNDIAEKLGKEFTNLPNHVIVAQPGNNADFMNQLKKFAQHTDDLPDDYKALLQRAINTKPSGKIHHAPIPKPSSEYFDELRNIVEKKNIIFFDDKEENTTAATRPNDNMIGIHFKNAIQFADELVKLGVLSEETDKEFLEDLRNPETDNPGVIKTINQRTQQGWNYIKSFYSGKEKTA